MAIKGSATITLTSYRDTQSVTRYYKLQTAGSSAPSKPETKPPSSDWTDSEPACDISKELYFCDLTIFSNGEGEYSKVSKSTSYEAAKEAYNKANAAKDSIDNLQIGGRNLLLNTADTTYYPAINTDPAYNSNTTSGYPNQNIVCTADGVNKTAYRYFWLGGSNGSNLWKYLSVNLDYLIKHNKYLTFSVEIKTTGKLINPYIELSMRIDNSKVYNLFAVKRDGLDDGIWRRYEVTKDMSSALAETYTSILFVAGWDKSEEEGSTLEWRKLKLEIGNKATDWTPAPEDVDAGITNAQTAADSKRRVFYNTPTVPYDAGDLWVQGSGGDILRCAQAKTSAGSYNRNDWVLASKYTDDSALTTWIEGDFATTIQGLEEGLVDAKIETYYQATDPSTGWSDTQKSEHKGDLWYNSTASVQKYYRWSGTAWQELTATPPQAVFDNIDKKATIYTGTTTPTNPSSGDLWFKGANEPILTYVNNSWVEYNKYTDDSAANNAQIGVDSINDTVFGVQTFEYVLNGVTIPAYKREDGTYYYILNDEEVTVAESALVHDAQGDLTSYQEGGIYEDLEIITGDIEAIDTKVNGFDAREDAIYASIEQNSLIARNYARFNNQSLIITNESETKSVQDLKSYLQLKSDSIDIYSNKVAAVAIGVLNNSGFMEMRGTSLFIAQESRLSTVRLRSAEKNGKLALVAGSDGHVSLKEVLD